MRFLSKLKFKRIKTIKKERIKIKNIFFLTKIIQFWKLAR